jgi:hypothetical protein
LASGKGDCERDSQDSQQRRCNALEIHLFSPWNLDEGALTASAMCGTHELNAPTRQIIPFFFDIGDAKGSVPH